MRKLARNLRIRNNDDDDDDFDGFALSGAAPADDELRRKPRQPRRRLRRA